MTFEEEVIQQRSLLMRIARGDEDLVQETMFIALRYKDRFTLGTNLKAWMVTILKNTRSSLRKKYWREMPMLEFGDLRTTLPVGTDALEARLVLECVTEKFVEPLILTHLLGFEYWEAAEILNIPIGTIKSRIHRAAKELEAA